ncbi:MAG: hypothetical protein JNK26_05000 [Candidatus Doudnabacteria bacterium]|nr:hypothetical protein [Candidatus Doudnabacteria bacterium]
MKKKLIIAALVIFVGLPLLLVVISTATTTEAATPDEPTVIVIFSPQKGEEKAFEVPVAALSSQGFIALVNAMKIATGGGTFTVSSLTQIPLPNGERIEAGVPRDFGF